MPIPIICLLTLVIIPYLLAGITGYLRYQQFEVFDNKNPRRQSAQLENLGERAWAAQSNAWEALTIFAPAVFVGYFFDADPEKMAVACLLFIAARITHLIAYLANIDILRSVAGSFGLICVIYLFFLAF